MNLDRLRRWMDASGVGGGTIEAPRPLLGGTQNVLLRFTRGDRDYVLRRGPLHLRADSNQTMQRESRVLAALAGSGVPHPRWIATCEDPEVIGATFYLMDVIDGFNAWELGLPALHAADLAVRHRMGLAMVDAIATLGGLDPAALGLADLGRPGGFLERQVQRWQRQLDSYADLPGWPGPTGLPGVTQVGRWLEAHRPPPAAPGLLHGDFHLANVMFRHDSGELAGIVDWEMATVGDPLLDLGWMLATWPQPDGTHYSPHKLHPWTGFATARELVQRYGERSPRQLDAMVWYAVLAAYKLGIVLEGTHARACAGQAGAAMGEGLHRSARGLMARAIDWIERGAL